MTHVKNNSKSQKYNTVSMKIHMVVPIQHTPNPSAHVPSLVPPIAEHSALSTKNSCL